MFNQSKDKKKQKEVMTKKYEGLHNGIENGLDVKAVEDVVYYGMVDSSYNLVIGENGWTTNMERIGPIMT